MKNSLCVLIAFLFSISLNAQGNILSVGDKMPEFKYSKWIKGTPINKFDDGKIYIFEFWATWCGPCKAAMPHLSNLAKKYKDKIEVIGVNIWEGSHDSNKQPYDSYLPKINRFVESMGDNMAYNVVVDNNEEFLGNNWMKAAGQGGIPCSFIIREGTILWIGHPIRLDSLIQGILDNKYDLAAERQRRIKAREAEANGPAAELGKIQAAMEQAVKEKQYSKAIAILDAGIEKLPSDAASSLNFFKFETLINHFSEKEAMSFVIKWQATNPGYKGSVGVLIARTQGLSKESYLYAVKLLAELVDNPQPAFFMYNEIATAYVNMDNYKDAVEVQEKAISAARQALKENKYPGFVTEDTIKEYEEKLSGYKAKL